MEGQTSTNTAWLGDRRCPYRGFPHRYSLDQRCPTTIQTILIGAEQVEAMPHAPGERKFEKQPVEIPHPVLHEDSGCFKCVYEMTREKEAGLNVRPEVNPLARLSKRRRRKVTK